MSLTVGTKLGPYEIQSALGAGGMGEVYRARDPRLGREVAIKVLPSAFSADPDRLHRFEQEARAAAALNHPNILAVYDIGQQDGSPYIVSELLEGETLRERLNGGALPVRKAVEYAGQIAHGLAAAHEKAIVHRDLKPENVFVTSDGRVKILDFGLAKLTQREPALAGVSALPTRLPDTIPGVLLGTIGYMSPEQVRGLPVDHRTDIFAVGVTLYEMLTGRRAFERDTAPETLTAILREDVPDVHATLPQVPGALEQVLQRCVEKDPSRRFQSTQDLAFALATLGGATSSSGAIALPPAARGWKRVFVTGTAVLALAAIGTAITTFVRRQPANPQPVRRVTISLPDAEPLAPASLMPLALGKTSIAISPDGSRIVYVANLGGTPRLVVRDLDRFQSRTIPGTDGAYGPFFAPDGQSVGFFSRNTLKKVSLAGGDPVTVCEARNATAGAWMSDGSIVFGNLYGAALVRVPAAGGAPQPVAGGGQGKSFLSVTALPDTLSVLTDSSVSANPDANLIESVSLEGGGRKVVLRGGASPSYINGYLLFMRGGSLLAAPFDLKRLEVTGPVVPMIEGVRMETGGYSQVAVSRDGTLVYVEGTPAWQGAPVWVGRDGVAQPIGASKQAYGGFALAPDGRRLAIVVAGATDDVWVYEVGRGTFTRLTQEGNNYQPVWSPDGRQIAYQSIHGNTSTIRSRSADGTGAETQLWSGDCGVWSWSPDGKSLALSCITDRTDYEIYVLPLEGDRKPRLFASTPFTEWGAHFSPDGRWIAYISDVSGRYEVYVRPYPGPGGQWQISTDGGEEPVWSRDGREIFYRNGVNWMAAGVKTTPQFSAEPPKLMFTGPYVNVPGFSYDVAPDGRFVLIKGAEETPVTHLNLVLNWFDELKRRVAAKR
jgi:serine/threonine-protein kinase